MVGLLFEPNLSKDRGVNGLVGAPLGVACTVGLADVDADADGVLGVVGSRLHAAHTWICVRTVSRG